MLSTEINTRNEVSIMDIKFINATKADLLKNELLPRLRDGKKSFLVTANPEIVMKTREDAAYKEMVQQADYVVPDGAGIIIASKHVGNPIIERIPGFELMLDLLAFAETEGLSCYLLGAKESINEKAVVEIAKRYPALNIAGHHHGYFQVEDESIVDEVVAAQPDLVFVALGSPRQEAWITTHNQRFSKGLFMGVGGSFDVLSGEVKRAPQQWINLNLEWLYRLLKQPFRLKRILKAFEFIIRIFIKKY